MKHRTMNRITSWAFALAAIFAVALALGMAGSAYGLSDNDYENVNGSGGEAGSVGNVTFIHTLKASAAADLSDIVYTISATPTDLAVLYAADRPVGVRDVPSVSGTPISGSFDIALSGASATDPDAGSTSEVKTYTAGKSLADLFGDADAFGQPGVYIFDVAEAHAGGSSTDTSTWAYGNESYRIRVYVINDPDAVTDTDLAYDGWTVEAISDNGKVSQMAFTSTYSAWRTLDISKAVGGDFGDKTYEFPFEVTVILPEWYDGTTPLTLDNMTQTTAPAQTGGAGPWTGVYQTSLHNGEHASITVPVGTYYKIDEKSAAAASEPGNVVDGVGMEYSVNIAWTVSQASHEPATPEVTVKDGFKGNVVTTMSMSQLLADAAAVAADADWQVHADAANSYASPDTSTVAGRYASYMMGDYSFSFAGDANSEPMEYRIIGLNHSPEDGETGITFMAKRILDKGYYLKPVVYGVEDPGWIQTELRRELNPSIDNGADAGSGQVYALIPQLVKNSASTVKKYSTSCHVYGPSTDTETQDQFWMPSWIELWGADEDSFEDTTENKQYALFAATGVKARNGEDNVLTDLNYTMSGADLLDGVDPAKEHYESWKTSSGYEAWTRTTTSYDNDTYTTILGGSYEEQSCGQTTGVAPCFNLH